MFDLIAYTPVAQFAVDLDGKIIFWNKSCEVLTGYQASEMLGTDRQWEPFYPSKRPVLADLVIKKDFQNFLNFYRDKNISRSEVVPHGWQAVDFFPDLGGKSRYIQFLAAPVLDYAGKMVGAVETLLEVPERRRAVTKTESAFEHITEARKRPRVGAGHGFDNIIGNSLAMRELYENIVNAAASRVNVIIYGESGTGKELVARAIHSLSARCAKEFVAVNCGAIPDSLVESEFFGYKKGAFSGADADKPGFLDLADGGTLFLDEVGEVSPSMQVKLLRTIEGGGFSPVGSTWTKKLDIRFISATKRNFFEQVKNGVIREDFFYRIHILPLRIPPLRERKEDIPSLIDYFIEKYSENNTRPDLPADLVENLMQYPWPGNVRELQNAIIRYLALNKVDFMDESPRLTARDGGFTDELPAPGYDLRTAVYEFEKKLIVRTLERCQWQRTMAAQELKVSRKTLFRKMKLFGLI